MRACRLLPNDNNSTKLRYKLFDLKGLAVFLYSLFCAVGLSKFQLWTQVTVLWESDINLNKMLLHPHGMRYLLVFILFSPLFLVLLMKNIDFYDGGAEGVVIMLSHGTIHGYIIY